MFRRDRKKVKKNRLLGTVHSFASLTISISTPFLCGFLHKRSDLYLQLISSRLDCDWDTVSAFSCRSIDAGMSRWSGGAGSGGVVGGG